MLWFWMLCAALIVLVVGAILVPFWRARGAVAEPAAAYDLRVYRDQLAEVERDLERGVIGPDDADRLRTEIGRKVLDADRRLAEAAPARLGGAAVWAAAALAVIVAGSLFLYDREGAPGIRDLPIAERFANAQRRYDNRPSQAEAEKAAPAIAAPEIEPEFAALMEKLRAAVTERPDDPRGLALLARNEARLGNLSAARAAQEKLIAVKGQDASGEELTQLAALMIEQAGGLITEEAESQIARALAIEPGNPQARYMVGLLQAQNGRPDRTFPIWDRLLREGPPDAPWIAPIEASIEDLAWLAGEPNYQRPQSRMPALPGPDAGQMAAAADMTPQERQQMIEGMVQGLQDRLTSEGGSAQEWGRLVSSLKMLGMPDQATDMAARARKALTGDAEGLAMIDAAEAGGAPAAPMAAPPIAPDPAMPGPTSDDVAAAQDMTPEERQQMIAGMVQRLESRLATQGGTPDEWARLISSLVMIGNKDHAAEIWGEAQMRFADQLEALIPIRAAAEQSGLTE